MSMFAGSLTQGAGGDINPRCLGFFHPCFWRFTLCEKAAHSILLQRPFGCPSPRKGRYMQRDGLGCPFSLNGPVKRVLLPKNVKGSLDISSFAIF